MTKPKIECFLSVRSSSEHGYRKMTIDLSATAYDKPDQSIYWPSWDWESGRDSECYDFLQIVLYCDESYSSTQGAEIVYAPYNANIRQIDRAAKTIKRLQKALDKIAEQAGRPQSTGDAVARLSAVMKAPVAFNLKCFPSLPESPTVHGYYVARGAQTIIDRINQQVVKQEAASLAA